MLSVKYLFLGFFIPTLLLGYAVAIQGSASAMDLDKFYWGEPSCDGITVGIAIESNIPNKPIVYHIALANSSASPRLITLFSTVPGLYRLRVIGRQGAAEESAPALYSQVKTSNPQVVFTETLAPSQVFQRIGDLTTFRGHLSGTGTLHIVFSSLLPHDSNNDLDGWCHAKSPELTVTFYP
jgi:hypothetical protein